MDKKINNASIESKLVDESDNISNDDSEHSFNNLNKPDNKSDNDTSDDYNNDSNNSNNNLSPKILVQTTK